MSTTEPKQLFDLARETLQQRGWTADHIGNKLTHPKVPNGKIRIHYTGGLIYIHGWQTKDELLVTTWDSADTPTKIIAIADRISNQLTKRETSNG
jgi:hypothetical protein